MLSRGIDRLMDAATHSLAEEDAWLDVIQARQPGLPRCQAWHRQAAGWQAGVHVHDQAARQWQALPQG